MTALAVIPTIAPVSPPRRAYSTSQLKTMATAIYNRLYVIYRELNPIVDAHNRAIDKKIKAIVEDTTAKLVVYMAKHGKPVAYDSEHRSHWHGHICEATESAYHVLLHMVIADKKHIDHCAKLKKAATDAIERLKGMQIKCDAIHDDAVLAAVTDEAVFGTSDDPSAMVYNRFVAQANELRAQMKDRVIE